MRQDRFKPDDDYSRDWHLLTVEEDQYQLEDLAECLKISTEPKLDRLYDDVSHWVIANRKTMIIVLSQFEDILYQLDSRIGLRHFRAIRLEKRENHLKKKKQ
jgi:hypothetical protein